MKNYKPYYKMIYGRTPEYLEEQVNANLEAGFVLAGGAFAAEIDEGICVLCQPMIYNEQFHNSIRTT